jgi:hypothetical protein
MTVAVCVWRNYYMLYEAVHASRRTKVFASVQAQQTRADSSPGSPQTLRPTCGLPTCFQLPLCDRWPFLSACFAATAHTHTYLFPGPIVLSLDRAAHLKTPVIGGALHTGFERRQPGMCESPKRNACLAFDLYARRMDVPGIVGGCLDAVRGRRHCCLVTAPPKSFES